MDRVRIALVTDPGLPADVGQEMVEDLPDLLRDEVSADTDWQVRTFTAPLGADEQVDISRLLNDVLPHLTDRDWDIGIFLTDLPRRAHRTPVSAEVSAEHRVALVSLPALGALRLRHRATEAVSQVIAQMAAPGSGGETAETIGEPVEEPRPRGGTGEEDVPDRYVVPGARGRLRLVSGMVRDNRPWQLFTSLSRALAGVFATAAYAMINSTSWNVAASMGPGRLGPLAFFCVFALTFWIIVDHSLWERPESNVSRTRARLYNLVTGVTIASGVLFLYVTLFLALSAVTGLLLAPGVLGQYLRHQPSVGDYFSIAWFVASVAMIGGAFGSGLEDDGSVRNAAYGERQRLRREKQQREKERKQRWEEAVRRHLDDESATAPPDTPVEE